MGCPVVPAEEFAMASPPTGPERADRAPEPIESIGRFSRRNLLRWLIGLSTGAFAVAFGVPAFALRTLQVAVQEIAVGDEFVYASAASGNAAGDPVKAADLQVGASVQAFPRGKTDNQRNLVEIVRIGPGQGKEGLVAYSAICTHLGCVVHDMLDPQGRIACPCHGSLFDPARGAAVVGGPAGRPLPSLPISVSPDGVVIATGAFSGPVGPQ
jgi:rieske iron-sulfur protein